MSVSRASQLVRAVNPMLKPKVLFGSDYPRLNPERWIRVFEQLEIRPLVLEENGVRALRLDQPPAPLAQA